MSRNTLHSTDLADLQGLLDRLNGALGEAGIDAIASAEIELIRVSVDPQADRQRLGWLATSEGDFVYLRERHG